jgi:acylaminoacyl-peptidase
MKTSSLPTTPVNNQHNAILLTLLLYMGLILLALSSANALAYYFESDQATGVADVQNEFSNSAEKVKQVVSTDLITKITLTNDADTSNIKDHQFPDSVQQNLINFISDKIDHDQRITVFNDTRTWTALTGETAGTHLLRFSILPQRYTTGSLTVEGAQNVSLYLNEQAQIGKSSFDVTLLNQDYRALMIVSGVENWQNVSISWTPKNASKHNDTNTVSSLAFDNDQNKQRPTMRQFFDSQTVGTLNLSPDGRWLLWSKQHYSDLGGDTAHRLVEILDMSTQQVAYRFQAMRPGNVDWRADSQAMVFTHNNTLFELTTGNWQLKTLATDVKRVGSVHYVNNDQLLFTWSKPEKAPSTITKRYRALQDRWSYWRGEQQLHLMDIESGLIKQLTQNPLKSYLLDIDPTTQSALISRSPVDYAKPPHSLTQLIELNIATGTETLLGEYRTFNSAQYHKDGIVIVAGPNFKAGLGLNLKTATLANDYDGQLYLMARDNPEKVTALSLNFDPSIRRVEILASGELLLSATIEDRVQLFNVDINKQTFTQHALNADVINGFTVSNTKRPTLVYKGSTATTPQKVIATSLKRSKNITLFDSAAQDFANNTFIDIKDWDYTTKSGQFIDGRVYYPDNFDSNKQYPAIVYYYGGTSPVTRGFTGRYPFNWYASMGYVVYVLQPSGTFGYGQDFSGRHVNAWGINTADEIIESTQAFVAAHPFVDKDKLGNMGASYGGFMTMHLATKTDMFAASISHAGISNLTSYWGYGWWGYGYKGIATRGNWPWNNRELYVGQSPVYSADKVTTPMLLVHGDADTNVPVNESHQMYTALKLLNQDVELIEFLGDDHHINSREHRFRWWQTKLAYFDKYLKDEPEWWEALYP